MPGSVLSPIGIEPDSVAAQPGEIINCTITFSQVAPDAAFTEASIPEQTTDAGDDMVTSEPVSDVAAAPSASSVVSINSDGALSHDPSVDVPPGNNNVTLFVQVPHDAAEGTAILRVEANGQIATMQVQITRQPAT